MPLLLLSAETVASIYHLLVLYAPGQMITEILWAFQLSLFSPTHPRSPTPQTSITSSYPCVIPLFLSLGSLFGRHDDGWGSHKHHDATGDGL